MANTFWILVLFVVYNAVLASCDPKNCGLEIAKCFVQIGLSKFFGEQVKCIESGMKIPDCENFGKEIESITTLLQSYEASGKNWTDVYNKFECLRTEKEIRNVIRRTVDIIRYDQENRHVDEPRNEILEMAGCCALPEYVKAVRTIPEKDCSQGVHEMFGDMYESTVSFTDLTLCDSNAKRKCDAYFPSTEIENQMQLESGCGLQLQIIFLFQTTVSIHV